MEHDDSNVPPEAATGSRREEIRRAFAEIAEQEREGNRAKDLRLHKMKLLGWPPPTNKG